MSAFTRARNRIGLLAVLTFLLPQISWAGESMSVPSVGVKTIGQAMINAKSGDTVWVADGVYPELIFVKAGVSLIARNTFKAVIDGSGKGTIVSLSANSVLSGFEIRNGTIGVFSKDAGNSIVNCRIINNWGRALFAFGICPELKTTSSCSTVRREFRGGTSVRPRHPSTTIRCASTATTASLSAAAPTPSSKTT